VPSTIVWSSMGASAGGSAGNTISLSNCKPKAPPDRRGGRSVSSKTLRKVRGEVPRASLNQLKFVPSPSQDFDFPEAVIPTSRVLKLTADPEGASSPSSGASKKRNDHLPVVLGFETRSSWSPPDSP